ncbi:MAG: hypothetical protein ACREBA_10425, partial [Nitrosotalea sp.]
IIQIPFSLPTWTKGDMEAYVKSLISNHSDNIYKEFFQSNIGLIAKIVEYNPREVKRLLNNFILSHQIQKNNPLIDQKKLLILHILAQRWRIFYDELMLYPGDLQEIYQRYNKIVEDTQEISQNDEVNYDSVFKEKIENDPYLSPIEDLNSIMNFLDNTWDVLSQMKGEEWRLYRRATIVEPDVDYYRSIQNKKQLKRKEAIVETPVMKKITPAHIHEFQKTGGVPNEGQIQKILEETIEVHADSVGILQFKFVSSRKQCSDFRLHLTVDQTTVGTTEWMGYPGRAPSLPLDTEIITIRGLKPGPHVLKLQPEGREGGCNEGHIQTWEGILHMYH